MTRRSGTLETALKGALLTGVGGWCYHPIEGFEGFEGFEFCFYAYHREDNRHRQQWGVRST